MNGLIVFLVAGAGIGAVVGIVGVVLIALIARGGGSHVDTDRLANTVPIYPFLDPAAQQRLEHQVERFLKQKTIQASYRVAEIMRVAIAGNACMMRLHEDDDCFPDLREVALDGESNPPRRIGADWGELEDAFTGGHHNPVVRGCAGLLMASRDENKPAKQRTRCPDPAWWNRFHDEIEQNPDASILQASGSDHFVTACEAYFQQGNALAHQHPGVYRLMCEFFGVETATAQT